MKTLDKGQEKIEKICSILRKETLEPAKKQAEEIIEEARKEAEAIIEEANKNAREIISDARSEIEKERNVFNSSLQQAAMQSIQSLRQAIEDNFFHSELLALIEKEASHPDIVAKLVNAIILAIEKEGLSADLSALVPQTVSPHDINALLLKNVLNQLKEKSVSVGDFAAGAQVKINNKKITIDLSEEALKDLLSAHVVRKDFRKMIFAAP